MCAVTGVLPREGAAGDPRDGEGRGAKSAARPGGSGSERTQGSLWTPRSCGGHALGAVLGHGVTGWTFLMTSIFFTRQDLSLPADESQEGKQIGTRGQENPNDPGNLCVCVHSE